MITIFLFDLYFYFLICVDLHNELILFEEWIVRIEEHLERFNLIRNETISLEDFQELKVEFFFFKLQWIHSCS